MTPISIIVLARAVIESGVKRVKSLFGSGARDGLGPQHVQTVGRAGYLVPPQAFVAAGRGRPASASKSFQYLLRMLGRFHFRPDLFDPAVRPNQEGYAMDPLIFDAHEFLFAINAVGVGDRFIFIG